MSTALAVLSAGGPIGRSQLAQQVVLSPEARAIRVDSAFHMLLKRYPSSAELAYWVNRLPGSGSTAGVFGTIMVEDIAATTEYFGRAGDSATRLMSQLYADLLSRAPASAEVSSDVRLIQSSAAADTAARQVPAGALLSSVEFRTDEITSFFANYLHPTCREVLQRECTTTVRTPTQAELSAALASLASGSTEADIIAGVLSTDEYYQKHGSTQTGLIEGVYQDLLGRAPSNAELSAALNKYTNDFVGHTAFAQAMVASPEYQNLVVSLDYQQLLLRAPFASEADAGQGVLAGNVRSLRTPEETLVESIAATSEYVGDIGGSDVDFVSRTINALLNRAGTPAEESAYLSRPLPHDAAWQASVAGSIVEGPEYRNNFITGIYERFLSFAVCSVNAGSGQSSPGGLVTLGATIVVGVVLGALIIAVGVPAILRRRVDTDAP
jgi:hypothetical protein